MDAITGRAVPLKCQSLDVLTSIQNGALSKSQVELVTSHTDEDISWMAPLEKILSVRETKAGKGLREGFAYLDHIIERWDSLANRTVFMHALQPSCGHFTRAGPLGNHLLLNTSLMDYVDPPSGAPPPPQASLPSRLVLSLRTSREPPAASCLVSPGIVRPCSPRVLHAHRH